MSASKLAREKATDHLQYKLLEDVQFLKDLPISVLCCRCNKVLKKPLQLSCGHRCCTKCEAEIMPNVENLKTCPIDNESIEYRFPDISALTEIMFLSCYCLRKEEGCDWTGAVHELEDHLKLCEFGADKPCPWSEVCCTFVGSKKEVEKHLKKENVLHNFLLAAFMLESHEHINFTIDDLREVKKMSKNLHKKILESSNHMKTTQDMLGEYLQFLKDKDFNVQRLRDWYGEVTDKISRLMSDVSDSYENKAKELFEKVKTQQQAVEEFIEQKPDRESFKQLQKSITEKIKHLQTLNSQFELQLSDVDLKIRLHQSATFDGKYIWKIEDLRRRMVATSNKTVSELFSPPLYTDRFGYKFSAKILLFGDLRERENGLGGSVQYVAIYFMLMKGEFDEILKFPFPHPVKLTLINLTKKDNVIHEIRPDAEKVHFRAPIGERNAAIGFSKFCSHDTLYSGGFVKDDTLYVQIDVDTKTDVFLEQQ